ncbi:MAG: PAS domain-containing protein [Salinibacterium sp.]|nr:PAS domain-containing protein [Salinibacterium sp.]
MTSSNSRHGAEGAGARSEGEYLIEMLAALVESLGEALPPTSELLLHDLSKLPNSIVAISGTVTRRKVGDPANELLLRAAAKGEFQTKIGYETRLGDGRRMKSSTVIVRDSRGTAIAAMCVNTDLSAWEELHHISALMLGLAGATADTPVQPAPAFPSESEEIFTSDIDELAMHLINKATAVSGIPVELMRKKHKIEIVRELNARGFFMLKGAADKAATALRVSRFTIYNYLNEISEGAQVGGEEEETA